MRLVLTTVGAEFLQLQSVRIVPAVFLGDVVAVLAHLACQGDLRPYVCTGSHDGSLSILEKICAVLL
jgi:hypothetical protein